MTLSETEAEVERIASAAHQSRDDDREKLLECIETMQSLLAVPSRAIRPIAPVTRLRAEKVLAKAAKELAKLNPPAPCT